MSNVVISANNLGKQYGLNLSEDYDTLRDLIADIPKKLSRNWLKPNDQNNKFWALKDISFNINKGDVMGLIGRNGAGKSTLLKILARIITPTTGTVKMKGKVASILEVGTGFHPELTGRENIYLNGAILGMKRREINQKFKDIVEFSEIGKFLDMPVKRYSSGMQVRLAFSVASNLEADILLIDEVLAVGDMGFRKKSLEKMQAIASNEGRTIIFVSHSMPSVETLCKKAILIEEGKVAAMGEVGEVIGKYVTNYVPHSESQPLSKLKSRTGNGEVRIIDFWIENEKKEKTKFIKSGGQYNFVFKFMCPKNSSTENVDLGFSVKSVLGQALFLHYMSYKNQVIKNCPSNGKFVFTFPKMPLAPGEYTLGIRVTSNGNEADYISNVCNFEVVGGDFYNTGIPMTQKHSPVLVEGDWYLET